MILLIIGLYAVAAAKLPITRRYGLKGKGARVGGAICIAFSLGLYDLIRLPITAAVQSFGLGEGPALAIGYICPFLVLLVLIQNLVTWFGNEYGETQVPTVQSQTPVS